MASRPSLLLPGLGPFLQHMQNITFQTESRVTEQEKEFQSPKYIFHSFMERLWAYLTIQQLLEQMWVARTPDGPLGQPHMARASSQAFPCGGGGNRFSWHGVSPRHRERGWWHLGKLQTLPVGTSQKGLEGRESPSIWGGPAEPPRLPPAGFQHPLLRSRPSRPEL